MCERRGLRLPYQDPAQALQAPDDGGIRRTMPALVNGRTIFRDQILCFDDVFHAKRNSGKRTISHLRLRKHLDPRVNGRIHALNALQARRQSLFSFGAAGVQPVLKPVQLCACGRQTICGQAHADQRQEVAPPGMAVIWEIVQRT